MRDLPTGTSLLALARDVLLNDLMLLLPQESRLDALLIANCMAIAEREAEAGRGSEEAIVREVQALYDKGPHPDVPPQRGEGRDLLRGREGAAPIEPLRRLGSDLRIGAFEDSQLRDRCVRNTLWRLTVTKLRRSNPRFLAANDLS